MGLHGAGRHHLALLPVGAPIGSGATFIPAKIPAYTVVDFASDWQVTPWLKLLAGISNLTDRRYYDRVWQTGLAPACGRTWYAGFELRM